MASKQAQVIIPENYRSVITKYILHFNIDDTLLISDEKKQPKEE